MRGSVRLVSFAFVLGTWLLVASPAMAYVVLAPECGGARWPANYQPTPWYLNPNGFNGMPTATVEGVLVDSFSVWSAPCCSSFAADYKGQTTNGTSSAANIVIFYQNSWPSTLGSVNSTIGVTTPEIYTDCYIRGADMAYNAVGFDFVNRSPQSWGEADLKSIAVHEIGHFLGMDHTDLNNPSLCADTPSRATMCSAYSSGIAERDLSNDDQNGVCFLYNRSCSCTSSSQCAAGESCVNSQCIIPPCQSDANCTPPLQCKSNGQCGPRSCSTNTDCPSGYQCSGGTCYPSGSCAICKTCTENADCGAGYICAYFEGGNSGSCTQMCPSGSCPGTNTACFTVSDGTQDYNICLNNNADTAGICPSGYTCSGGGVAPTEDCAGLGNDCSTNPPQCSPANDVCLDDGTSVFCSCSCLSDADCGAGNTCAPLSDGSRACVPGGATGPCANINCAAGQVCNPATGTCVSQAGCPGLGNFCGDTDNACISGVHELCVTSDGSNYFCTCYCGSDPDCGAGNVCVALSNGQRACAPGPCAGKSCPAGQSCDPNTGNCVSGGPDVGPTDTSPGTDTGAGSDTTNAGTDTGVPGLDTGAGDASGDANPPGGNSNDDDCGCATVRSKRVPNGLLWLGLGALGLLAWRRRR